MKCIIPGSVLQSLYAFWFVNRYNSIYLPEEIVFKIYRYVLRLHYANIINTQVRYFVTIRKCVRTLISNCVCDDHNAIIKSECIEAMQYLIKSKKSKRYRLNFYARLLQVISKSINSMRFMQRCNGVGFKTENGKKLLLMIDLWLQLCKKYNLRLGLETRSRMNYVRARELIKLHNYDQYIITPMIIRPFTQNNWINIPEARRYLVREELPY